MNDIVQWLIRNSKGEVQGPLTTVEVIRKIRQGIYFGDEFISRYPSGRWYPIAYDENFFNILLEVLEGELSEKTKDQYKEKEEVTQRIEIIKKNFQEAQTQEETIKKEIKKEIGNAVFEDVDAKTPVVIEMQSDEPRGGRGRAIEDELTETVVSKKRKKVKKVRKKVKPGRRRARRSQLQILILLLVMGVAGTFYFLSKPRYSTANSIHLRRPDYGKAGKANKAEIKSSLSRAIKSFRKDSFKDYLVAQDALVEVVEKSNSGEAYSFLCMVYRELWPFSKQSGKDLNTIETVLRRVQKKNPKSIAASVCMVVNHWVRGHYDDALRIMDNQLAVNPGLLFFNQMTGDIYAARRDYRSAVYYFSKVRELWSPPPVWSKAILQEARMYRRRGANGEAVRLYRALLNQNPEHSVGRIELGLLELEPFQNINKARDYIRAGLASQDFIPKDIESEAYVALAKINILQGNNKQALKLAQKSFSVDSSNQEARELVVSLGGIKALNSVSISNVNMVYLGEQYMKMRDYNAAQAEFRSAFKANNKNGFAALRAGEALWQLNQSREAIEWIKKSITADPTFVRGYLVLADYQSARFDYINAVETLKGAYRVNRKHHGIFRGFAQIEVRRRNFEGAIRYAEKALELYDTDIESLSILAEALYRMEKPEDAFPYIQRALELDSSDTGVHILFGKILASLQGSDAGIDYLDSMITKTGNPEYMRGIGELLVTEERKQEAIQYYFEALQKNPKDKKTLMALGKLLQSNKDYDRARDYLLEAATLDPSDAEPLFLIGQLYLDSNKNSFALKQFERVISVNPNYPLGNYYAGLASLALNKNNEALEYSKKEKVINPDLPEPYILAADAFYNQKQYKLCTEEFQKVLAKGLRESEIFVKLGRCYRLDGAFDSALTVLSEAEKIESGNPNIYKELGALYQGRASFIKAVTAYKYYLQLNPRAKDRSWVEAQIKQIESR